MIQGLVPVTDRHCEELMAWFPDRRSCQRWGGPNFRFPFTTETFREDTHLEQPSFSLVGESGELLGFGQFYVRAGRCHLARLAIAPERRERGLGARLIRELSSLGCQRLDTGECGLFVMSDNNRAVRLYTRLGFVAARYPEEGFDLPGCVYMVASLAEILETVGTLTEWIS